MRISDWSSDVCSSDLPDGAGDHDGEEGDEQRDLCAVYQARQHVATEIIGAERVGEHALFLPEGRGEGCEEVRPARVVRRDPGREQQNGRASCRERVCQYGVISVVAVFLKKK